MIAGALIDGHVLLGDWLLLIAAVLAVVAAVAAYVRQPVPRDLVPSLVPLALAVAFVGLLVL